MNYGTHLKSRTTELSHREVQLWLIVVVALLIDVLTTWYVVSRFGVVAEGNPIMAYVMAQSGIAGLVTGKIMILGIGFTLREIVKNHRWVIPFGVLIPSVPVAIINTAAILTLVL